MASTTLTRRIRRAILKSADETQSNIRIEILPGIAFAPRSVGESWHYETRGGTLIRHPNAYAKRGWSNMVYVRSTRRIIVGEEWIAQA